MVEIPDPDGPILIPPREFTFIGPGIYLSSLPHSRSLPFLRDQRIESALFLTPKPPHALEVSPDIHEWMLSLRFKWLETPKIKGAGKIVATPLLVKTALEYILEAPKPILISGYDGIETGALIVSCFRKLQCWDTDAIMHELGRSIHLSLDALHHHFVTNFCSLAPPPLAPTRRLSVSAFAEVDRGMTLSMPAQLPPWLWFGSDSPSELLHGIRNEDRTGKKDEGLLWHPTMRLRRALHGQSVAKRTLGTIGPDNEDNSDQERVATPRGILEELCPRFDNRA